jgi:hypothetical protein
MSRAQTMSLAFKEVRISGIGRDGLRALARFLSFRANLAVAASAGYRRGGQSSAKERLPLGGVGSVRGLAGFGPPPEPIVLRFGETEAEYLARRAIRPGG